MMKTCLKIWSLLVAALLLFGILSTFDRLTVFGHQLATIGLFERPAARQPLPGKTVRTGTAPAVHAKLDTLPKTILFVGDSMLEGLSPRLAAYAKENGHTLYTAIWYGSTTERWGKSDRLKSLKSRYKPDYIVVCLGGNELFIRDIVKKRAGYVDAILSQIGGTPYVWIGPPNWKEDTGINALLQSKVGDGRFFLSAHLRLDRAKDGAHPTRDAAAVWMDTVADWIVEKSDCPIRLNRPSVSTGRAARTIVYQPND